MRSHYRAAHGGWTEQRRVKPQFIALMEAVGSFQLALHFADRVIDWTTRPPDRELREWAQEAQHREEMGQPIVTERQVARMERRLRKAEEWDARKTNGINRKVLQAMGEKVLAGDMQLSTGYRYAGDNWHWGEKAVKESYGKEKDVQQGIHVGRLVINAGERPQLSGAQRSNRLPPASPPKIIDVKARTVPPSGS
jgi:hypothetical protein